MKLSICIPGRDMAYWRSWSSIMQATLQGIGYLDHKFGDLAQVQFHSTGRATVCEARNMLMATSLKSGADWILWMDDDAVPPPNMVEWLFDQGKDLIAPVFFKRNATPVTGNLDADETGKTIIDPYPPRLFKADVTGFHTVLMRRHVAEDVCKQCDPHPPFNEVREGDTKIGEDYWFFRAAKQAGHQLWIDSRIDVGHIAVGQVGMKEYEAIRPQLKRAERNKEVTVG